MMMARLSTHVLDTVRGGPAKGVAISLFRLEGSARHLVAEAITNADGRTDVPLLAGDAYKPGTYELPSPAFLDVVPIRFGMHEPDGHYHVPLLASPHAYSTYRGS
jgi:5-hydroxyisourate hydrolase